MALKLVMESLDNVDEALKPLYVEHDGKFHLDADADSIRAHRDVLPLANAYDRTKADLGTAKTKLTEAERRAAPEGFDPDAWKAFKEGKPDAAAQQRMVELRTTLEAERDGWKGKYEGAVEQSRISKVNTELTDALGKAGITNPAYIAAVRALLAPKVALDGENGVMDIGLGPMGIAEAVKRWTAGDEGKAFVSPPKGDDARGNDRGSAAGKTVSAKELEGKTPQEKAAFFEKNPGVTITD